MVEKLKHVYETNNGFRHFVDKGSSVLFAISALGMIATAGLVWIF